MCKEMPSVIALSETKLSDDNFRNIAINGYKFISNYSPTNVGGVGLYIKEDIEFIRRQDIEFDFEGVETSFIEIPRQKNKNIIIGCIYRHPLVGQISKIQDTLREKLNLINQFGYEAYLAGDINVNFLSYTSHNQTSEYLDMLFESGYMPLITKATRITYHSKTLIDHIYTNAPEKVIKSGICLADITDHLPCFCTFSSTLPYHQQQRYFRDFSYFKNAKFIDDLKQINFLTLIDSDVNSSINSVIRVLERLTEKHAPLKRASQSKRKQLNKPWLTKGILASIKKKHKLFKSHFLTNDPDKIRQYKTFNNKLNRIKLQAKRNYFESQFAINKGNIKATWKLIGMIINRGKKKKAFISKLLYNNKCFIDQNSICDKLNEHFINVGPKLADQLQHRPNTAY